jgi:hypothetical protein
VVGKILSAPIAFLGNLVSAVKQGFEQFVGNIGKHLSHGLMGWLLGELADTGIEMPETFDLKGILNLVAQVLGLTWANIRARASAMLGEPVVAMIEQGEELFSKVSDLFKTIRTEGLGALWHLIADKIGDLKEMVIGQIKDFVITKVITAGVTWIIGLLNPASAFIKACKAIYDIIMFFVDRGSQIMALVNAILDNLEAIVAGNISAAANLVESVLGKAIPLVIGFLASLLGVGGISEKVKEVINAVRRPLNVAVDWLLKTVVKPIARLAMKAAGWVKGKVVAGAKWVKDKAKAGVNYLKAKGTAAVDKIKGRFGRGKDKDAKPPVDREAGLAAAQSELAGPVRSMIAAGTTPGRIRSFVMSKRARYGIRSVAVEGSPESSRVVARITEAELVTGVVNEYGDQLHKDIRAIAQSVLDEPDVKAQLTAIATARAAGAGSSETQPRQPDIPGSEISSLRGQQRPAKTTEHLDVGGQPLTERQTYSSHPGHIRVEDVGKYREMQAQVALLKSQLGVSDGDVIDALERASRGQPAVGKFANDPAARRLITGLSRLLYTVEPSRSPAALVHAVVAGETISMGGAGAEATTQLPMSGVGVGPAARGADTAFAPSGTVIPGRAASLSSQATQAYLQTEKDLIINHLITVFTTTTMFTSGDDLRKKVRQHLMEFIAAEVRKASLGQAS